MTRNTFTEAGAQSLRDEIAAYWRQRGAHVRVWIEPSPYLVALRGAAFFVRSDLLNGRPSPAFYTKQRTAA
jgi:hypothetical protein